jgi:hypothetical protein
MYKALTIKPNLIFLSNKITTRLTTRPVLECTVRLADETSNRTIECPVFAQTI